MAPTHPEKALETVPAALRAARQRAGMTQGDVAEQIGMSAEVYGRFERGKILPSIPSLLRICAALGARPDELLGDTPSAPPAHQRRSMASLVERLPDTLAVRRLLRVLPRVQGKSLVLVHQLAAHLSNTPPRKRRATPQYEESTP